MFNRYFISLADRLSLCHVIAMGHLSRLRWMVAWVAILGLLSLPLAAAQAMHFDHGSMATVADLAQQDPIQSALSSDADPCCVSHQSGDTINDCGNTACVGAASCMAKCVPGTAALIAKAASAAIGSHLVPSDDVTAALFGPEPPMEPPRS